MNTSLNLKAEEVNYFDLEFYLIKNCETMFSPIPITERDSVFGPGRQIGQSIDYQFKNMADVYVSEYDDGKFFLTVTSPNYEKGIRRVNDLKEALGLTKRRSF